MMCIKWVMWQVIAGSVHETGGLVVYFGSVGGQKKGGETYLGPHRGQTSCSRLSAHDERVKGDYLPVGHTDAVNHQIGCLKGVGSRRMVGASEGGEKEG